MPKTPIKGKLADRAKETGVIIPLVAEHLRTRAPEYRRQDIIHPSEMAKAGWCVIDTYEHILNGKPREDLKFTQENIFAEGNSIHTKWQTWLQDTGQLWGDWQCPDCGLKSLGTSPPAQPCPYKHRTWEYREIPLWDNHHLIAGHADGGIWDDHCLIEFKSVGLGTIRMDAPHLLRKHTVQANGKNVVDLDGLWKNIHRPLPSHMRQGQIYLWLAREMGLPFDRMQFVYEFKANQQTKEFSVALSDEIVQPLLDKALRIKQAVEQHQPPACDLEECKSCHGRAPARRRIVRVPASMN